MPDRPRRLSPMFRGSLALVAILLSAQCGGSTRPECSGVSCNLVPPTLDDPTAATLCALQAAAELISAAGGTLTSSITTQDCEVADVPPVLSTNPGSDGFFESLLVYISDETAQEVDLEVQSTDFDPVMVLFEVNPGLGSGLDQLTELQVNDDQIRLVTNSLVRFTMTPGVGYLAVIAGFDEDETGDYTLFMRHVAQTPNSPPKPDDPGNLEVTVVTQAAGGEGPFTVRVEVDKEKKIDPNDEVNFPTLEPGAYDVELDVGACTVTSASPVNVTMSSNQTTSIQFDVDCSLATGSFGTLRLSTVSTGNTPDPDGYQVLVDGSQVGTIGINQTDVDFTGITSGTHAIQLIDTDGPCLVINGLNPRNVVIGSGQTTPTTFEVQCDTNWGLSIVGGGDGDGVITSSPGSIDCTVVDGTAVSGTCTELFAPGTQVTLTTTPTSGVGEMSSFLGWSGACSGSSCTVTMNQNHSATASFQQFFELVIAGAGTGDGLVTDGGTINCTITAGSTSGACSEFFQAGATVTLTATPVSSADFQGWSGPCTGRGGCSITLSQPETVTATFQ